MRLHYDPDTDALYIRFAEAPVIDSEEVRPGVVLDFDDQNRLVAIEVLNLRRHFPDADVKRLHVELPT